MFKHLSNTKKFSFLKLFSAPFSILISGTSCCFSKASVFFSLVFGVCSILFFFSPFIFLMVILFCLLGIPKSFLCIKAFSFLCFFSTFKSLFFFYVQYDVGPILDPQLNEILNFTWKEIIIWWLMMTIFLCSMGCMSSNSKLGDVLGIWITLSGCFLTLVLFWIPAAVQCMISFLILMIGVLVFKMSNSFSHFMLLIQMVLFSLVINIKPYISKPLAS